jgi:hypothetical protein
MKKCVNSGRDSCYYPIANCRPMCYDSVDQSKCACDKAYPDEWIGKTCSGGKVPESVILPNKPDPTSVKVEGATLACVPKKSVGQCGKCQTKDQCKTGYCCPFMKKCVNSGSDSCYYPIANCRPMCYDSAN